MPVCMLLVYVLRSVAITAGCQCTAAAASRSCVGNTGMCLISSGWHVSRLVTRAWSAARRRRRRLLLHRFRFLLPRPVGCLVPRCLPRSWPRRCWLRPLPRCFLLPARPSSLARGTAPAACDTATLGLRLSFGGLELRSWVAESVSTSDAAAKGHGSQGLQ